ncbi:MAG TPA: DUF2203 domain-containing protein [Actinomycetes bacterium]|jgi:hypothetical protein|nr:DUF2203 domain-containing protein [Actinomycetes bacterium]
MDRDEPYWTVEEANAALPRVRETVLRIQELVGERREQVGRTAARIEGNGHAPGDAPAAELRRTLQQLSAEGIVLRDVDNGLVDFPARSASGRQYLLCWLVDEPEVAWWHWPDTGFAGRRPLSDPPE